MKMAILSISRDWGVEPSLVRITTTDDLTEITTTGYLNTVQSEIEALNNGDFQWNEGDAVLITYEGGINTFTRNSVTNAFELMGSGSSGGIVVPTLTDHIIVALDNEGSIGNILTNQNKTAMFNGVIQAGLPTAGNPGFLSTYTVDGSDGGRFIFEGQANVDGADVIVSNSAHESNAQYFIPDAGAATANFLMNKFPGTQAIESGNLQIDQGDFIAKNATPNTGSIRLRGSAISGNFDTIITNPAAAQQTVYTVSDAGVPTASIVTSVNASARQKTVISVAVPGGSPTSTIVDPFCTEFSFVSVFFLTQTTPGSTRTVVPSNGSFDVTANVDLGPATLSYQITN